MLSTGAASQPSREEPMDFSAQGETPTEEKNCYRRGGLTQEPGSWREEAGQTTGWGKGKKWGFFLFQEFTN